MANGEVSVLTSKSKDLSLRINDNPSLIKIEGEIVTLFCKFSSNEEAVLREVVWYRELEDGTNSKLLTYDAVMNITQVSIATLEIEFLSSLMLYCKTAAA